MNDERYLRQHEIIPPEKLATCRVTVIGVGAIGRQVALQCTAMGVPWLQLIDPDIVEPVNLGCQGYLEDDVGRTKVNATGDLCHQTQHQLELYEEATRFRRSMKIGNVVFCCVDSIQVRALIWNTVKDQVQFFGDGRMSAEVIRIVTACDENSRAHYPTTLFRSEEAYRGSCTAKSTIFTANIAAGFMLEQFSRWLRCFPVDMDLQLNLLASELAISNCNH